jgi:hypothetical protein
LGTIASDGRFKHGGKHTRIWNIYNNMKYRCTQPKHPRYEDYGGRGITVCDLWLTSFDSFRTWSYSNGYSDDLTLDRKENNLGYSPSNCRWVTTSIQNVNQNIRKDNTSGFKGVFSEKGKWRSEITYKGQRKFLGYFTTPEEASEAYELAFSERQLLVDEDVKSMKKSNKKFIITDTRFPNELSAVKERCGITIQVRRGEQVDSSVLHESETALDNSSFDYVIINNGTIEELVEKVKDILVKEKIIL